MSKPGCPLCDEGVCHVQAAGLGCVVCFRRLGEGARVCGVGNADGWRRGGDCGGCGEREGQVRGDGGGKDEPLQRRTGQGGGEHVLRHGDDRLVHVLARVPAGQGQRGGGMDDVRDVSQGLDVGVWLADVGT